MGVVFRATDLHLKRQVAIKTLPGLSPGDAARLKREAQAMASINHTNLAAIYGIESWRGTPFLVEEFMVGGTLANRLRGGPLPVADTVEVGRTLAAVLGHLHANGIVHCDVKPSNILLFADGTAKLADLGRAVAGIPAAHDALQVPGDRSHAPPEMLYGPISADRMARGSDAMRVRMMPDCAIC